jgi:HAD superfamily hydrolase (TIGR01549 family)
MKSKRRSRSHAKGGNSSSAAILFDLDGTLLDTVYWHVSAWAGALASEGIQIPAWKIHRRVGMSGSSMMQQLIREQGLREDLDVKLLEQKHDDNFTKVSGGISALPGAQDLLNFLTKARVPWAIATTGNQQQTRRLLKRLSIPAGVPVVTGDDVAKAKPAPDIFMLAADKLGLPISECMVTGDSVWDMLAAARKRALGIGLLCGGYGREELSQAGAFRIYADPMDMLQHIEDLGIERVRS